MLCLPLNSRIHKSIPIAAILSLSMAFNLRANQSWRLLSRIQNNLTFLLVVAQDNPQNVLKRKTRQNYHSRLQVLRVALRGTFWLKQLLVSIRQWPQEDPRSSIGWDSRSREVFLGRLEEWSIIQRGLLNHQRVRQVRQGICATLPPP